MPHRNGITGSLYSHANHLDAGHHTLIESVLYFIFYFILKFGQKHFLNQNLFAVISMRSKVVFDVVKANSLQLAILQSIFTYLYLYIGMFFKETPLK